MQVFAVIGLPGAGKSTLVRKIAKTLDYPIAMERIEERPFHDYCLRKPREFALLNQMDFLINKIAEERRLSLLGASASFIDSCVDQDFAVYTSKFHADGWLSHSEFDLCRNIYSWYRERFALPRFIVVSAHHDVLRARMRARSRASEIATEDSLVMLERYFEAFLKDIASSVVLCLDTSNSNFDFTSELRAISSIVASPKGL